MCKVYILHTLHIDYIPYFLIMSNAYIKSFSMP